MFLNFTEVSKAKKDTSSNVLTIFSFCLACIEFVCLSVCPANDVKRSVLLMQEAQF